MPEPTTLDRASPRAAIGIHAPGRGAPDPFATSPEAAGPEAGLPPGLGLPDLAACRLALVGNAPDADRAAAVDAADRVVRFNNAAGLGGRNGSRVDLLALVSRGGQMREWLDDPGFLDRPALRRTRAFLLAFPALPPGAAGVGDGACWAREAAAQLAPLGRPVRALGQAVHAEAARLLGPGAPERLNPSTGFIVALALLAGRAPGAPPVDAYGFGFAGWPGHPWDAERAAFAAWAAEGRLRLHPPRPAS